jgi:hypothetical protein
MYIYIYIYKCIHIYKYSGTGKVDIERNHLRNDNNSDYSNDNRRIDSLSNAEHGKHLTSYLEQTARFTLGEWQLLGPSPVPAPVPIDPSPVLVPTVYSKSDATKANEEYRSRECSAIYSHTILSLDISSPPPLIDTLNNNKTLSIIKTSNSDPNNHTLYTDDSNPQNLPGAVPPYPPRAPLRPKSASAIPSNRMTRNINFEQDDKSRNFSGNL